MPYTKTNWVNGTTAVSQANMNNLETQFDEATLSQMGDALANFIYAGGACTIHGGLPKQMDVTTCTYYANQSDPTGTLRRRQITATNFTTVTASTTYFLYYAPDGTSYWSTVNSPPANSLAIATVTTDGSGNISVITDARGSNVNIFPNSFGYLFHRGVSMCYILSNGGGAAGHVVWVGTTDPGGSAVEGDIWCKG